MQVREYVERFLTALRQVAQASMALTVKRYLLTTSTERAEAHSWQQVLHIRDDEDALRADDSLLHGKEGPQLPASFLHQRAQRGVRGGAIIDSPAHTHHCCCVLAAPLVKGLHMYRECDSLHGNIAAPEYMLLHESILLPQPW